MLYTSYLSNLKYLPEDKIKLVIMRYPPKWLDFNKYKNLYPASSLSPSKTIFNEYNKSEKNDSDWDKFYFKFINEIYTRQDMVKSLKKIINIVLNDEDIYLICCESDYNKCHRNIIAKYIKYIYGIKCEEFIVKK